jgi:hypothetical protein
MPQDFSLPTLDQANAEWRDLLVGFMSALCGLLAEIAEAEELGDRLGGADVAEAYREAWRDWRGDGETQRRLEAAIRELPDAAAADFGLRGPQLRFKLLAIHRQHAPFLAAGRYTLAPLRSGFRKLLELIDVLLGSVIGALTASPPGLSGVVGEGLKEIKEYVEKLWE